MNNFYTTLPEGYRNSGESAAILVYRREAADAEHLEKF